MTKAQLLAVGSTAELCEVVELGKYWGFRCGHWLPVKVLGLPCARGGTGEIAYAPIDKRGYPYAGGIALRDCQALWGPVKAWGDKPPKVSRRALLEKGVSEFWLRQKKRAHNTGGNRRMSDSEMSPANKVSDVERLVSSQSCAWCERPNASVRPMMSDKHPACSTCYKIWYSEYPETPQKLRELSLAADMAANTGVKQ